MAGDGELSVDIRCHGHVVTTVNGRGIRDGVTGGLIDDIAPELCLHRQNHSKEEQ